MRTPNMAMMSHGTKPPANAEPPAEALRNRLIANAEVAAVDVIPAVA